MSPTTSNTSAAVEWLEHDGGRQAAGYKGTCGDCAVRAVATLTRRLYKPLYLSAARHNAAHGRPKSVRKGLVQAHQWLVDQGFTQVDLPEGMTVAEVAAKYPNCLLRTTDADGPSRRRKQRFHLAAIVNGTLHDTWNSNYDYRALAPNTPRTCLSVFLRDGRP